VCALVDAESGCVDLINLRFQNVKANTAYDSISTRSITKHRTRNTNVEALPSDSSSQLTGSADDISSVRALIFSTVGRCTCFVFLGMGKTRVGPVGLLALIRASLRTLGLVHGLHNKSAGGSAEVSHRIVRRGMTVQRNNAHICSWLCTAAEAQCSCRSQESAWRQ